MSAWIGFCMQLHARVYSTQASWVRHETSLEGATYNFALIHGPRLENHGLLQPEYTRKRGRPASPCLRMSTSWEPRELQDSTLQIVVLLTSILQCAQNVATEAVGMGRGIIWSSPYNPPECVQLDPDLASWSGLQTSGATSIEPHVL